MQEYGDMGTILFMAGDTLRPIIITPDCDTTGCTMACIVSRPSSASDPVLDKPCTAVAGGFECIITSEDTKGWSGMYDVHFVMTDADDRKHRKLYGRFDVKPVPFGGE